MTRYVLNSAVITAPGRYEYRLCDAGEARAWLLAAPFVSCLGYVETATALERATGVRVPVSRREARMQPGDEALVFRLRRRVTKESAGGLTGEDIARESEIGILRCCPAAEP